MRPGSAWHDDLEEEIDEIGSANAGEGGGGGGGGERDGGGGGEGGAQPQTAGWLQQSDWLKESKHAQGPINAPSTHHPAISA